MTLHISGEASPREIQTPEQFAAALTDLRQKRGLSIRALSTATKVPPGTLGGYFGGRHLPNPTQWRIFAPLLEALGVSEIEEQREWHEALLRVRRARGASPGRTQPSPYRGLEPFAESDSALFFGRQAVVAELLAHVAEMQASGRQRLWWLIGPSGSGKSSVLRAGLVAGLPASTAAAVIVPGTQPLDSLQAAVSELEATVPAALIVIDQAEEIFSAEVDPETRKRFIDRLAELTAADNSQGLAVVLGLRADFYGQAASEAALLPSLSSSQTLLGAMSVEDLRDAITGPAQAVGVSVDADLVELVLRDVVPVRMRSTGHDPGALPLVSHSLLAAWQHRSGQTLSVSDYLAAGGLAGAVKQSAETVMATFDESGRAAAQWLFTQLVLVDSEGSMTRRRVDQQSLHHPDPATDQALDAVIEAFIGNRLLTAGETTLEISHEALLTAWPRLHDWVLDDLDAARLQSRIAEAASIWVANGRDPDLLLRGGPLLDAQTLAARPATSARTLTAVESEFVAASTQRTQELRLQEHRRSRRLRAGLAAVTVLAIVATVSAGVALRSRNASTEARNVAQANQLAVTAETVAQRDSAAAAQLALAGFETAPTIPARSTLLDTTSIPVPVRFVGPVGEMHAAASPDGTLIAVSSKDGSTTLWQRGSDDVYTQLGQLPDAGVESPGPIWASTFSPDGRTLVTADVGDGESTVLFWDVSDAQAPVLLRSQQVEGSAKAVSYAPDGSVVAVGTSTGAIYRFAGGENAAPETSGGWNGEVTALGYSPDSTTLAVGTSEGDLVLLKGSKVARSAVTADGVVTEVTDVAFHPDGNELATSQKSGDVRLWTVRPRLVLQPDGKPFGDFDSWVNGVEYSPDGRLLAAASSDGHVKLFADRAVTADLTTPSNATSVQFVREGRGLLTSEVGGTARLWSLPLPTVGGYADAVWGLGFDKSGQTLMVAPGVSDGATYMYRVDPVDGPVLSQSLSSSAAGPFDGAASMSADGSWVAAGTLDGHVGIFERRGDTYLEAGVPRSGKDLIESVAVSPDGQYAAAVGDSALLSVWRLTSGQAPQLVETVDIGGLGLSVTFDPSGRRLAVGTGQNTVRLWDIVGDSVEPAATLSGFTNYVYGIAFNPTGEFLAAGSADQTVRLWDLSDWADPMQVGDALQGPGGTLYSLAWNRAGNMLAAASKDGSVWLWEMSSSVAPDLVATLKGPGGELYSVTFDTGDRVLAGGVDQQVTSWHTDAAVVAGQTCANTGMPISASEWDRLVPGMEQVPVCQP